MYFSCRVLLLSSFASSLLCCWLVCIYLFIPLKPGWTVTPAGLCISAVSLQLSRWMRDLVCSCQGKWSQAGQWSVPPAGLCITLQLVCSCQGGWEMILVCSCQMRDDGQVLFTLVVPGIKLASGITAWVLVLRPPPISQVRTYLILSSQNLSCNLTQSSPGQRLEFIHCICIWLQTNFRLIWG